MMSERIVIVQRRMTHYRVPLFVALRQRLAAHGLELRVAVGAASAQEQHKGDTGELAGAWSVPTRYALADRICWLSLAPALQGAQWVVLPQELGQLANLPLLLAPQPFRVALWGHGANHQARGWQQPAQRMKRLLTAQADWCFAYTESSARLMRCDVPVERVTVLNNAIDTNGLQLDIQTQRALPRDALRGSLGVGSGPLALFIGSLYADKRLDLLIDAAERMRARLPDFELAICGAGVLAPWLAQRTASLPWIHRPGRVSDQHKARWLAVADVMLNPGVVGLCMLDAFAAALPLITSDCGLHPPEIDYLRVGHNGLMPAANPEAVAAAGVAVLRDAVLANRLRSGAMESARLYTLPAMVEHFTHGLLAWRASTPRRGTVPA